MKRMIYFLFALTLMFACESKVPNKIYTEYDGVSLPQNENNRGIMNKMLNLIEWQDGKFSDQELLGALSIKQIKFDAVFFVYDFRGEQKTWCEECELDGARNPDNLLADDNGQLFLAKSFYVMSDPSIFEEGGIGNYLSQQGYGMWYLTHAWSYDSTTNVLTTTNVSSGESYKAEVLYFDGVGLILKGKILGCTSSNNGNGELYLCEFDGDHESFFERKTTGEEYFNIWDSHCKAEGIENEYSLPFFIDVD